MQLRSVEGGGAEKNDKVGTKIVKIAKIRGAPPASFAYHGADWRLSARSLAPSFRARYTASNPYSSHMAPVDMYISGHGEFRGSHLRRCGATRAQTRPFW